MLCTKPYIEAASCLQILKYEFFRWWKILSQFCKLLRNCTHFLIFFSFVKMIRLLYFQIPPQTIIKAEGGGPKKLKKKKIMCRQYYLICELNNSELRHVFLSVSVGLKTNLWILWNLWALWERMKSEPLKANFPARWVSHPPTDVLFIIFHTWPQLQSLITPLYQGVFKYCISSYSSI